MFYGGMEEITRGYQNSWKNDFDKQDVDIDLQMILLWISIKYAELYGTHMAPTIFLHFVQKCEEIVIWLDFSILENSSQMSKNTKYNLST